MSLLLLDKLIEKIISENTANLPQNTDDVTDNLLLNLVKPTEMGLGNPGGAAFDAKFFQELAPSLSAPLDTGFLTKVMKSISLSLFYVNKKYEQYRSTSHMPFIAS